MMPLVSSKPVAFQPTNDSSKTVKLAIPIKYPTDKPRYIADDWTICSNCGNINKDLNRCEICYHRLPNHVRTPSSAPTTTTTTSTTTTTKTSTNDSVAISNSGLADLPQMSKQELYYTSKAISPILLSCSRDVPPLHSIIDNLLKHIEQIDEAISKAESHMCSLRKKEEELQEAVQEQDGAEASVEDIKEPRHHGLAQIIYAENKKKAEESHNILGKLTLPTVVTYLPRGGSGDQKSRGPVSDQDSLLVPTVLIQHLRIMSKPVKCLVETGRVVAVQQDRDGLRSSRITLQGGRLYLHTLLHQAPPAHSHTIQHSDVMGTLDPSSTLAFLDLGWAGLTRGRVYIRLSPDTGLARQFVLLCTGQQGHTYCNTNILQVFDKGQPGEHVGGGDYECNDGTGGASLLPDLHDVYRRSGSAGAVRSWWGPVSDRSAQFFIMTRDCTDDLQWPLVFGEVESGLDVVRAAANHSDIREVTIVDCGIVLPL